MKRTFYKLSLSTLVAVYLLILVGGVVRSSGSGMGCPDWPTCFGHWVPPTDVSELPADYKDFYSDYRHKKNVKFAKYLSALGMTSTADKILSDESITVEADFNATKTWTEYINRLVGVVIGLLIFAVLVYSIRYRKSHTSLFVIALLTFVLVGFQGWIGSVVVSTNLTPWTVTLHMFLAIVIVALLIYLVYKAGESTSTQGSGGIIPWLVSCIFVLLVQILFGTQVREGIDRVAAMSTLREGWLEKVGLPFIIHRSFSWIVLILHGILLMKMRKFPEAGRFTVVLFVLVVMTIVTGTAMAYLGIPPFLQPVHLLLATVTIGVQFMFLLKLSVKHSVVEA